MQTHSVGKNIEVHSTRQWEAVDSHLRIAWFLLFIIYYIFFLFVISSLYVVLELGLAASC